jgi:hypothetical protein
VLGIFTRLLKSSCSKAAALTNAFSSGWQNWRIQGLEFANCGLAASQVSAGRENHDGALHGGTLVHAPS